MIRVCFVARSVTGGAVKHGRRREAMNNQTPPFVGGHVFLDNDTEMAETRMRFWPLVRTAGKSG